MKERTRGHGMVYVKFALIIIAAALVGGVVGYGAAANEAFLPAVMEALDRFLVWVGPWWFAPVYLALILGTVFYLRGRALLPQAEEDDGAFQRADRQLSVGLVFTGAAVPGMLTAMGLAFAAAGEPLLEMRVKKADLEEIFLELTEADPISIEERRQEA